MKSTTKFLGVWSGLGSLFQSFVMTVNDTQPRFFYCSVENYCQSGMVFALNQNVIQLGDELTVGGNVIQRFPGGCNDN